MSIDQDGLHPFIKYVLRKYYQATGWNDDNQYSNLTRSSDALLDFAIPRGLQFSISKAPNPQFQTSYRLNVLPSLSGSIGYIFSSCGLDLKSSGDVRFKDVVDRFKVYQIPKRPEGKDEEWLAGKRVDARDYLLSGQLYIPTGQLQAFYTTRWSPTLQASVSCINEPNSGIPCGREADNGTGRLLLSLQHDTGRWGTEYTWESDGSMFGLRVLRNFGRHVNGEHEESPATFAQDERQSRPKRVDEEDAMEGGLRGRISAGAELYVSPDSAGVSTAVRFTTLPDSTNSLDPSSSKSPPSQPPTTITAYFTPVTGHFSTAYAARVSRDLALCSRFSFNVYDYESDWTMGGEWWMRRRTPSSSSNEQPVVQDEATSTTARSDEIQGVVKARFSTSADVSFLWEGRIRNALVSLGVKSNLSDRTKPIKAIGMELAYFSSDEST